MGKCKIVTPRNLLPEHQNFDPNALETSAKLTTRWDLYLKCTQRVENITKCAHIDCFSCFRRARWVWHLPTQARRYPSFVTTATTSANLPLRTWASHRTSWMPRAEPWVSEVLHLQLVTCDLMLYMLGDYWRGLGLGLAAAVSTTTSTSVATAAVSVPPPPPPPHLRAMSTGGRGGSPHQHIPSAASSPRLSSTRSPPAMGGLSPGEWKRLGPLLAASGGTCGR